MSDKTIEPSPLYITPPQLYQTTTILDQLYDVADKLKNSIEQKNLQSLTDNYFSLQGINGTNVLVPQTVCVKLNDKETLQIPKLTLVNSPILELKDLNFKLTTPIDNFLNSSVSSNYNVEVNVSFGSSESNGTERLKSYLNF